MEAKSEDEVAERHPELMQDSKPQVRQNRRTFPLTPRGDSAGHQDQREGLEGGWRGESGRSPSRERRLCSRRQQKEPKCSMTTVLTRQEAIILVTRSPGFYTQRKYFLAVEKVILKQIKLEKLRFSWKEILMATLAGKKVRPDVRSEIKNNSWVTEANRWTNLNTRWSNEMLLRIHYRVKNKYNRTKACVSRRATEAEVS